MSLPASMRPTPHYLKMRRDENNTSVAPRYSTIAPSPTQTCCRPASCLPCVFAVSSATAESPNSTAELMYAKHSNSDLPAKLKGVFWFSDNKAPELLVTFENAKVDVSARVFTIPVFGGWAWSLNNNCLGFAEICCLGSAAGSIRFEFNPTWSFAKMPITVCWCCALPESILRRIGFWYEMRQLDESGARWARDIYNGQDLSKLQSYTLIKVLDQDGKRLQPAYDDMIRSINEKVPAGGGSVKTAEQFTKRCSPIHCCCC